jgi:glycosyltransferase involved in cell wall biosynthesis
MLAPESAMVKNILYINLTAKMSGAEFSLLSLMTGLDKKKFQPILLLPEPGPFLDKARTFGIETIILPHLIKFGEYFHFWKIPKAWWAVFRLRKIIRRQGISLVHCNTPRASYIGGLAAKLCKIPSVTHIRDIGQSPFGKKWQSRLIGFLSDRMISVSRATKNYVSEMNPFLEEKIKVIYNGVDLAFIDRTPVVAIRHELGIPASAPLIGVVGRIEPGKGLDILIQAAEVIKKTFPLLRILIIGSVFEKQDQAYLDKLVIEIAEKGLKHNVVFTGFRPDALGIMKALDVLVHPALCPDSLPRTVIEAAGLKKTIVASRVGGIPEILQDSVSGILVEPGNAEALAEAVLFLLANPEEASRLGEAARQKIACFFDIKKHLAEVTDIYESL